MLGDLVVPELKTILGEIEQGRQPARVELLCPKCRVTFYALAGPPGTEEGCPLCGFKVKVPPPGPAVSAAPIQPHISAPVAQFAPLPAVVPPPASNYSQQPANLAANPWAGVENASIPSPTPGVVTGGIRAGSNLRGLASPSFLALALLAFVFPWVEVRCNAPNGGDKLLLSQSGLQAVYGGCSPSRPLQKIADQKGWRANSIGERANITFQTVGNSLSGGSGSGSSPPSRTKARDRDGPNVPWAPLLSIVIPVVLLSVGAGLVACRPSRYAPRDALWCCAICAGLAALLLLVQILMGFPIENAIAEGMAKDLARGGDADAAFLAAMAIETRPTAWPWVSWFLIVASIPALVWGHWQEIHRYAGPHERSLYGSPGP